MHHFSAACPRRRYSAGSSTFSRSVDGHRPAFSSIPPYLSALEAGKNGEPALVSSHCALTACQEVYQTVHITRSLFPRLYRSQEVANKLLATALDDARMVCEACDASHEWDLFEGHMRACLYGTDDHPGGQQVRLAKHGEDAFIRFPKLVERRPTFKNIINLLKKLKEKIENEHPRGLPAQRAYASSLLVRFQLEDKFTRSCTWTLLTTRKLCRAIQTFEGKSRMRVRHIGGITAS